ncbi:spermatogenesis-associated protein 31D1-like isoform X3 [Heterocephalus glaber]|uniref:Spermatogenesis-associated protein 31D1-like isoform X3 n=1 Tax=Heterocephalus glaber TaxID=10181 RepID=A0AAX6RRY3_HETGA|nr:spermatogenesis-associated protein 31D1-like isoform X3 [Heterocephalus glaber]
MENVFSFLNSHTEPQLNFGSTFLDTDPNYTFLTAVGWLSLLVLCYLFLKSHLPALWKDKDIQKRQVRAKRRTRSRTVRSWRTSQREAEEERKLLSILTSTFDLSPLEMAAATSTAVQLSGFQITPAIS